MVEVCHAPSEHVMGFLLTQTGQLITLRLLIGLFEAGFYPTALFYLSTFYTRFDLGVRIGLFYGQYAIAGAFSGAIGASYQQNLSLGSQHFYVLTCIAYGVFHLRGSLHNWQYLFIIEGALTMFFAVASCLFLPSDPGSAWFLNKSEREFAKERMHLDGERYILGNQETDGEQKVSNRLNKRDVVETAKDWKLWTILVCNICASVPSQAFSVFLPLVVKGLGYTSIEANLVKPVPPLILKDHLLISFLPLDVCSTIRLWGSGFISYHLEL